MNIENMTIQDVLKLQNVFKNLSQENSSDHEYVGKYVIVRSYDSGVHFGKIKRYNEQTRHVCLEKSRRLWKWMGFTLSAVANDGMSNHEAKIAQELPEIIIANVIELIPCTEKSIQNISNYPVYIP